jgi:hypothetical protein
MGPSMPDVTFRGDGIFAHRCPPALATLTMSVCCMCGEYICASQSAPLVAFVEGLHRCPA